MPIAPTIYTVYRNVCHFCQTIYAPASLQSHLIYPIVNLFCIKIHRNIFLSKYISIITTLKCEFITLILYNYHYFA